MKWSAQIWTLCSVYVIWSLTYVHYKYEHYNCSIHIKLGEREKEDGVSQVAYSTETKMTNIKKG